MPAPLEQKFEAVKAIAEEIFDDESLYPLSLRVPLVEVSAAIEAILNALPEAEADWVHEAVIMLEQLQAKQRTWTIALTLAIGAALEEGLLSGLDVEELAHAVAHRVDGLAGFTPSSLGGR